MKKLGLIFSLLLINGVAFMAKNEVPDLKGKEVPLKKMVEQKMGLLDYKVLDLTEKEVSLKEIMGKHDAIALEFWASWCGPCMASIPGLLVKANKFKERGILVVGMNEEGVLSAKEVKEKKNVNIPWYVEKPDHELSKLLEIRFIPRMVIISHKGEVIYNDSPSNDRAIEAAFKKAGIQ